MALGRRPPGRHVSCVAVIEGNVAILGNIKCNKTLMCTSMTTFEPVEKPSAVELMKETGNFNMN